MTKGRGGARQDPDMGPSPWAGSLRHVDDKKKKAMMKKKKKEDGTYYELNSDGPGIPGFWVLEVAWRNGFKKDN